MLVLGCVSSVYDYFFMLDCFRLCPEDVFNGWYKGIRVWTFDLDAGVVMICCGGVVGCSVSLGLSIISSSSSVSSCRLLFALFSTVVVAFDGVG